MDDGILVAHDMTDRCRPVAAAAGRLAAQLGVPLSALHVVPKEELEEKRDARPEEAAYTDLIVGDLQNQLRAVLDDATLNALATTVSVQVLVGDPHSVIAEYLDAHDFDYAFLGVRNRSRVGKLVFGSVAQSVLLRSRTKIVAVPLED